MTDTLDTMTAAAVVERQKLQRHFGRFDILFFLICTIVGVDTIATVAQGGGEAFTWMMIFAVVFFVPQALLFAELRRSHPDTPRPFRMPAYRPLTVILMVLVAIASVQLIAPGLGKSWFGADFIPSNWTYAERYTYLWTELIPVLLFIAVGVLFWWLGRRTRAQAATVDAAGPVS